MKFIFFSDSGFALYDDEYNANIPEGAIELTDELYATICSDQRGQWVLQSGEVVMLPPPVTSTEPAPPHYPKLMTRDFLALFTRDEKLAVKAATRMSDELGLWYDEMLAAQYITAEDPATLAGLDALVAAALLTAERHDEILAAMQPVQIEN